MKARGGPQQVQPDVGQECIVRSHSVGLELRTPMHVLNKEELQKAIGRDKLPRHMATIPAIKVPTLAASKGSIPHDGNTTETVLLSVEQVCFLCFLQDCCFAIAAKYHLLCF